MSTSTEDSADVDLQQRTVELLQLARDQDDGWKFSEISELV